jgi:hypothetical protein
MQEFHVVAYNSQEGKVLHPEYVVERPNLSQDTRTTVRIVNEGTVRVIIWWMYDDLSKLLEVAFTNLIVKEVQLRLTSVHA